MVFNGFRPNRTHFPIASACSLPFLTAVHPLTPTLAALFSLTASLHGQIYADFDTSLGSFSVELDPVSSPRTVANFIGLATGTKTWVDSTNGQVMGNTPYFTNRLFHRIRNDDRSNANGLNFIQGGSVSSEGLGGPGYVIPEELASTTFDQPYQMAMANRGPQSNSSGFFITTKPTPGFDGRYTIFGTVPEDDGPGGAIDGSRTVVDTINAVPLNGETPVTDVVTNAVTIRRVGTAAENFDETAQELPLVMNQPVEISFPGLPSDPSLLFTQAPGTTFLVGHGDDLQSWSVEERYLAQAAGTPLSEFAIGPEQTNKDRQFYQPALIQWPAEAIFPDTLAGATFSPTLPSISTTEPFHLTVDATGNTGTWTYDGREGAILSTVFLPDGYGATIVFTTEPFSIGDFNFTYWVFQRVGLDLNPDTPPALTGKFSVRFAQSAFLYQFQAFNDFGDFTLTP
jgi:peptidyl-prolyl cis-trans isomerase A (cyclophilin A)